MSHNHWNRCGEIKVSLSIVDKIAKYVKIKLYRNCKDVNKEKHKTVLKDKKKKSERVEEKNHIPGYGRFITTEMLLVSN